MGIPIIGYANVFNDGNITVTHVNSNFPKENAIDWLTYSQYGIDATGTFYYKVHLGYADNVDYLGIASHNLGSKGATVTLQYYDGTAWSDLHTAIAPTNDNVIFIKFTNVSDEDYRLEIVAPITGVRIGMLAAGSRLAMQRNMRVGWAPQLFNNFDTRSNFSENNTLLGRSVITRLEDVMLEFPNLTEAWVRANWSAFVAHAKSKPFFFMWDSENNAGEVGLFFTKNKIPNPSYNAVKHMTVKLSCKRLL